MAITKEKKKEILDELKTAVKDAETVVFAHFKNMPVVHVDQLRSGLYNEGVQYKVAKKTLINLALDAAAPTGEKPVLEGEIALAYGMDKLAPARGVYEFHKAHKEEIEIVGGIFEGTYKDKQAMMEIATIPPLPILRGMFVNVINSPIAGLVVALGQIAEKKEA